MLLIIDNYDSFTHNIAYYLCGLGEKVKVIRNNELSIPEIKKLNPDRILLSPGPCTPKESGISLDLVRYFSGVIPIFGVCLGHQIICHAFHGEIVKAEKVMHGKISVIQHSNKGVFTGLKNPLQAVRYNSLLVKLRTLPSCLELTAWSECSLSKKKEVMGIRHKTMNIEGVQFHPESILTEEGESIFRNFIKQNSGMRRIH